MPSMKMTAAFQIALGASIVALWAALLTTGGVPEVAEGRIDIWFHIAAEACTGATLLAAGVLLLRGSTVGRPLSTFALGALVYTAMNSAGYYAESGTWPVVGVFAVLAAVTVVAAVVIWLHAGDDRAGSSPRAQRPL